MKLRERLTKGSEQKMYRKENGKKIHARKKSAAAKREQFCSNAQKSVSDYGGVFLRFAKSGGWGSRGVPLRNVILLTIWLLSIALPINGKKSVRSKFYNGKKSAVCVQGHFCSCAQKGISDFGGTFFVWSEKCTQFKDCHF